MMTRRGCLYLLTTSLLLMRSAQSAAERHTQSVAFLGLDSRDDPILLQSFLDGLRVHGYSEGKNVRFVMPDVKDRYDLITGALTELVRENVDVIVTRGSTATTYASKATQSIPIVMVAGLDPVKAGFTASLSHPERNITGLTLASQDLAAKRLQILQDLVPVRTRVGVLVNPESKGSVASAQEAQKAARALGLELSMAEARTSEQFDVAFRALSNANVASVFCTPSTMFTSARKQLVMAAARYRLPTLFYTTEYVEAGGLVSYGPDQAAAFREAGAYVAKILGGMKPGDLPIEQPTKLELVINLKTAKAINIKVPQSVLLRADRVIQ